MDCPYLKENPLEETIINIAMKTGRPIEEVSSVFLILALLGICTINPEYIDENILKEMIDRNLGGH